MSAHASYFQRMIWQVLISLTFLILSLVTPATLTVAQTGLPSYSRVIAYDAVAENSLPDVSKVSYTASGQSLLSPPTSANQTFDSTNKVTVLDASGTLSDHAGYSIVASNAPELDPALIYRFNFTVKVVSEAHNSTDRAGFSAIVLGKDHQGIELGFWSDRIWAQSATFSHAEEALYDTTSGLINYQILVKSSSYYLFANGTQILTGSLRDYRAADPTGFIYSQLNFTFLGDDTTSAGAKVNLSKISIEGDVGLLVNSAVDNSPTLPAITLRQAKDLAPASGAIITFDQAVLGTNNPTVSISNFFTLPANIQLVSQLPSQNACTNRVSIMAPAGFQLAGNNLLQGLNITVNSPNGPIIPNNSRGNKLFCTKLTIL